MAGKKKEQQNQRNKNYAKKETKEKQIANTKNQGKKVFDQAAAKAVEQENNVNEAKKAGQELEEQIAKTKNQGKKVFAQAAEQASIPKATKVTGVAQEATRIEPEILNVATRVTEATRAPAEAKPVVKRPGPFAKLYNTIVNAVTSVVNKIKDAIIGPSNNRRRNTPTTPVIAEATIVEQDAIYAEPVVQAVGATGLNEKTNNKLQPAESRRVETEVASNLPLAKSTKEAKVVPRKSHADQHKRKAKLSHTKNVQEEQKTGPSNSR